MHPEVLRPAAADSRDGDRLARRLGAVIAAAFVLQAALFGWVLWRTMILRPFSDMLAWIDADLAVRRPGGAAGYFWAPHNEHHLLLIRALTALDVTAFRAGGVPFVAAGTAALLACAGIAFAELRRLPCPAGESRNLAWLGPMLLLTAANAVDCATPIYSVYPLTLAFVMASLLLFEGAPGLAVRRVAALLAAVLAALANAVGLVVWPVLLWSAWHGRAGARWLAAIAAFGSLYVYAYLHTLPAGGGGAGPPVFRTAHLLRLAWYFLGFLGLPVSVGHGLAGAGRAVGALLLVASLLAVLRCGRPGPGERSRSDRIGVGLIMTALGAAVLAAIGRADAAPAMQVPVRYAVLVAPAHVGLLLLLIPRLAGAATPPAGRIRALGAGVAAAGVLLVLQVGVGHAAVATADRWNAMLTRFYAGHSDPAMVPVVYPDLAVAARILADMRAAGLTP